MKRKKEYPRKRKRFIKKVIFLSIFLCIFVVIASGAAYYFFIITFQKPLYVSPLSQVKSVQAAQDDIIGRQLQNDLKKRQIGYTTITKNNDYYVVTLSDGGKVTFSTQKDIMTQIASLQYILSHLTMEGRQFSTLDLRFDKPVVIFKQ